jgi:hypothetical protein
VIGTEDGAASVVAERRYGGPRGGQDGDRLDHRGSAGCDRSARAAGARPHVGCEALLDEPRRRPTPVARAAPRHPITPMSRGPLRATAHSTTTKGLNQIRYYPPRPFSERDSLHQLSKQAPQPLTLPARLGPTCLDTYSQARCQPLLAPRQRISWQAPKQRSRTGQAGAVFVTFVEGSSMTRQPGLGGLHALTSLAEGNRNAQT